MHVSDRHRPALSQRFGSALNLNILFHMLLLDGVYAAVTMHTASRNSYAFSRFIQYSAEVPK